MVNLTNPKTQEVTGVLEPPPNVEQIICSKPWQCSKALAVAQCESELNPRAYNARNGYYGLFQIDFSIHANRVNGNSQTLFDPATNTRVAYEIYRDQGGWNAWPVCGRR